MKTETNRKISVENKTYTLSQRALNHIINGDYTLRVDRHDGKTSTQRVISGGLHTFSAWRALSKENPAIKSLDSFDPSTDQDWYYAKELQNGVIAIKIPRILFNGKAADLTLLPETNYKSGYLWKTLFPKNYTEINIIDCIEQALKNIDKENSSSSTEEDRDRHIVGYAFTDSPMTAIRIQIQLKGYDIRSAFPTWSQPYTGNNGKPFSYSDSISFTMSESVIGRSFRHLFKSAFFTQSGPQYELLKKITPIFTITKTKPAISSINDEWRDKRLLELKGIAKNLNSNSIKQITTYLDDHAIRKSPSFQQQMLYESGINEIFTNPLNFNTCQIPQNIYECFYVILEYDKENNSTNFLNCMERYLSSTVIHTGGIHLFELKRLYKLFSYGAATHPHPKSVKAFIESLSFSPSRAALYHEFNINTYCKGHDEDSMLLIGTTGRKVAITSDMLIDFTSLNLGENYLLSFTANQRENIANKAIFSQYKKEYINDSLRYFIGTDFDFFSYELPELLFPKDGKERPDEKYINRVIRDYHRMLVMYRQRVVLENPEAYKTDRFELEYMSEDFCRTTIQQHKVSFISISHHNFLESIKNLASENGAEKISLLCDRLIESLKKESIPLPCRIPDYIDNWTKHEEKSTAQEIDYSIFEHKPAHFHELPVFASGAIKPSPTGYSLDLVGYAT